MIASEAQPFSKTGGLADVATALPKALGRLGHEVTLMTPRYRGVASGAIAGTRDDRNRVARVQGRPARSRAGPGRARAAGRLPGALRPARHLQRRRAGLSRQRRSIRLSVGRRRRLGIATGHALRHSSCARLAERSRACVRTSTWHRRHPGTPGTVFTIHNLAYQGLFDKTWVPRLGLRWQDFTIAGFEFYDRLSFLKAGLAFSDAITTVSPTYAEEIQRPEYGDGLDGVIRARRDALAGILNGIDTTSGIRRPTRSCRSRSTPITSIERPRQKKPCWKCSGCRSPTNHWRGP